MLQFIRSKAGSLVVKILFVLLIGSFGIWGVGDFLRQGTSTDSTVIKVGSTKIPAITVQQDVQNQVTRLRSTMGPTFSIEQAKALGVVDQVVDGIVTRTLVDDTAKAEHLAISTPQILAAIRQEAAFRGKDGNFDPTVFRNVLAANNLTELQYEVSIRDNLSRSLVTSPLTEGAVPPKQLIELMYQIRNEQRVADWIFLPVKAVKDPPAPDAAALNEFFQKNKDSYTAPEYRNLSVLPIRLADILDTIHPSDQDLKDAYQQRQDEFNTPETRHVLQMLLQDEAAANKAAEELAQAKDFITTAKIIAGQEKDAVDLDWVKQSELPGDTGAFAFSAKDGEISKPIKGDFGWSILKVAGIRPAHVKSFDEAKPELETAIKNDQGSDALYKLSNRVEDAIAAGTDFDGLVQRFSLKPTKIDAIDASGNTADGKPLANPPIPLDKLTQTAFATTEGQMSGVLESGDGNSFFIVRVDHVTPSALKPFDTVKSQVQDAWLTAKRATLLTDAVNAMMADIKKGTSFADIAKAQKLAIATTKPFIRTAKPAESGLPPELAVKLFHLDIGQVAFATTTEGGYLAQLKVITPADPAANANSLRPIQQELAQNMANEYIVEFGNSLKRRFPVDIHKAAIDELFTSGPQ